MIRWYTFVNPIRLSNYVLHYLSLLLQDIMRGRLLLPFALKGFPKGIHTYIHIHSYTEHMSTTSSCHLSLFAAMLAASVNDRPMVVTSFFTMCLSSAMVGVHGVS